MAMARNDNTDCSIFGNGDGGYEKLELPNFEPIEKTCFDKKLYKSVCERYYEKRYKLDDKSGEHLCVLEHSNRICLVTLAPNHPIIEQKKKVELVDFKINDSVDRTTNKVSGRLKRGAQWLNTTAVLCNLKCSDGSRYSIVPGLKANLIEVNELLSVNPNLVVEQPFSSGYIAILLAKHEDHTKEMKKLKTEEDFWLKVKNNTKINVTKIINDDIKCEDGDIKNDDNVKNDDSNIKHDDGIDNAVNDIENDGGGDDLSDEDVGLKS